MTYLYYIDYLKKVACMTIHTTCKYSDIWTNFKNERYKLPYSQAKTEKMSLSLSTATLIIHDTDTQGLGPMRDIQIEVLHYPGLIQNRVMRSSGFGRKLR
jgi:hypothetical protein